MTIIKIVDLLECIKCDKPVSSENVKDFSVKLILRSLIKHLNCTEMEIGLNEEDAAFIQVMTAQTVVYNNENSDSEDYNGYMEINVGQQSSEGSMRNKEPPTQLYPAIHSSSNVSLNLDAEEQVPSLIEQVSTKYSEFKNFIEKAKEAFGENIEDTLQNIKLAADFAKNNRLRQIYFHEEIYKRVGPDEPDKEFKPMRRGPREIILRKAADIAKDETIKIGDLTESKEELIREEKLLPQLVEREEKHIKKLDKEQDRKVLEPFMSPQDVTIERLNALIKEHESIKCYLEYIIYHVNTLADFTEASLPLIFANDANFEGLRQKLREIHLTPSEYIVTKKLQEELLEFYETFVKRADIIDSKLTNQSALLLRHDDELYSKINNLYESIDGIRSCINKMSKQIKKKNESLKDNGENKEMLAHLNEEVMKTIKEYNTIKENQKEVETNLEAQKYVLLKLREAISKLKASKLNKFELEKLLSNKADCNLLNSKVSEKDFSLAYNDLMNGQTSVLNAIESQNLIWEALTKQVTNKLSSVVEKNDFDEYIKRIANVISTLQNNMIHLRETFDTEASGTKTKYLRNLKCISCNQGRVMKKNNDYPQFPALPKLPPSKNYKLDLPKTTQNNETSSSSSITDRYVGGSHTVINPKEKVYTQEVVNY